MKITMTKAEYESMAEIQDVLLEFAKQFPAAHEQLEGLADVANVLCLRYEMENSKSND